MITNMSIPLTGERNPLQKQRSTLTPPWQGHPLVNTKRMDGFDPSICGIIPFLPTIYENKHWSRYAKKRTKWIKYICRQ